MLAGSGIDGHTGDAMVVASGSNFPGYDRSEDRKHLAFRHLRTLCSILELFSARYPMSLTAARPCRLRNLTNASSMVFAAAYEARLLSPIIPAAEERLMKKSTARPCSDKALCSPGSRDLGPSYTLPIIEIGFLKQRILFVHQQASKTGTLES